MITNKTAREFVIAKKLFPDISTSVIETDTATGTIARFETNMTEPILEGIFAINPYQEGTGDPSPSNPRAIHGYTGINIHVADGESPHIVDNTYPISWQTEAGTVYGGELNATTGVLRVTHGKADFDDLNWVLFGSGTSARWRITSIQSLIQKPSNLFQILDMTMEQYLPINYGASLANYPNYMSVLNTGELISYAYDTVNKPKGLCIYPLATPTELQLTPQEVRTLLGENNIYHDCNGDSTITYKKSVPEPTTTDKRQFLPLIYGKKYYRKEY